MKRTEFTVWRAFFHFRQIPHKTAKPNIALYGADMERREDNGHSRRNQVLYRPFWHDHDRGGGYAYLDVMNRWLKDHGMPPITRVYKTTRDGKRLTLEDECLQSCSLPSIAYGFKRCSLKHKIGPQEKFCNHYPPCQKAWAAGKRVVKFIGYDAGEGYRSDKVLLGDLADPKYSKWYPLMEWGWDRAACMQAIENAGLPQPGKSSCFFCPSMRRRRSSTCGTTTRTCSEGPSPWRTTPAPI